MCKSFLLKFYAVSLSRLRNIYVTILNIKINILIVNIFNINIYYNYINFKKYDLKGKGKGKIT